ncbi:MAG: chloride channel protein [Gemmatimonadota bacterium]|nr:chloride channel protein [Gemmatimonadota bacterium]
MSDHEPQPAPDLSMASPARRDGALPVSPGFELEREYLTADHRVPDDYLPVDGRTLMICGLAIVIAAAAGVVARILISLISFITNIAFFQRFSTAPSSPADGHVGLWVLVIPIIGALGVGVMARYGSSAIRGHGIPEVMEKVLYGESRIPMRVMFLKPLSAALAIGTGGPFGAEGPIIATGGALGSIIGQFVHVSSDERKTLLAAGAAAGMAATFGSPVSAVLLAVELLLFEYRPRSLIPVSLAAAVAAGVRVAFEGTGPVFAVPPFAQPGGEALAIYALLGAVIGAFAVGVSRFTYIIEDAFEHIPVHWMWWPAFGAVAVGICGYLEPRVLGVGYNNITDILAGTIVGRALIVLVVLKLIAWAVYLGSGTSGGTLAPLFTIGGGAGALAGAAIASSAPSLGVDARVAALVGMAATFAGASHALLTSIVFAFETTRQPVGLLPLLAGCTAAYLTALLLSRHSIMTEKLARRGAAVRTEYSADHLAHVLARDAATAEVVTLNTDDILVNVREWLDTGESASHQGFPVLDADGLLVGVVTRRDLLTGPDVTLDGIRHVRDVIRRAPAVVYSTSTLRDAADLMVTESVGRLPVVNRASPRRVVGILTRSDLLYAHGTRLAAGRRSLSSGSLLDSHLARAVERG